MTPETVAGRYRVERILGRGGMATVFLARDAELQRPVAIKPMLVSKLNTGTQIAFAALVLSTKAFILDAPTLYAAGMVLVTALTIISGAAHLARWMKHMAG